MADQEKADFGKSSGMPRSGLTEDARTEILDAAASAFMRRGFTATSIDDVADSLGSTKGRIYHYYRSKTDIFLEIHLEALRQLLGQVGAIAEQTDLSPDRRLFEMCHMHVVVFMTTIAYQKATVLGLNRFLLSITAPYQDEASKRVQRLRDQYEELFVSTITEGIARGIFREVSPRFATKPLLGALNWANIWYSPPDSGSDPDIDRTAVALATFCVKALLKYPQSNEAAPDSDV